MGDNFYTGNAAQISYLKGMGIVLLLVSITLFFVVLR